MKTVLYRLQSDLTDKIKIALDARDLTYTDEYIHQMINVVAESDSLLIGDNFQELFIQELGRDHGFSENIDGLKSYYFTSITGFEDYMFRQ